MVIFGTCANTPEVSEVAKSKELTTFLDLCLPQETRVKMKNTHTNTDTGQWKITQNGKRIPDFALDCSNSKQCDWRWKTVAVDEGRGQWPAGWTWHQRVTYSGKVLLAVLCLIFGFGLKSPFHTARQKLAEQGGLPQYREHF